MFLNLCIHISSWSVGAQINIDLNQLVTYNIWKLGKFRKTLVIYVPAHIFLNPFTHIPHEKLHGMRRVSNPTTSIDPSSLKMSFLVLIPNAAFVRDNGTNSTKEGHRGRKPVSKKLLGQTSIFIWISIFIHQYVFDLRVNLYVFDLWVLVHIYISGNVWNLPSFQTFSVTNCACWYMCSKFIICVFMICGCWCVRLHCTDVSPNVWTWIYSYLFVHVYICI